MKNRTGVPPAWREEPLTLGVSAFVFLCIVLGGGGAEAPLRNGILEALAAALLCVAVATHFTNRRLPAAAIAPVWLLVATLGLIAAQLAPLPHWLWANLPGRETAAAVDQLIGSTKGWRPLSLDPEATRRSAAALFVPAAVLIGSLQASNRGLLLIARAIVLGALFSALFGAVQSALGSPGYLSLYDRPEARNGAGFFANPNHQAQLMLAGILSTSLLIRLEKPQVNIHTGSRRISFHFGWFLFPIFIVGVIATESRAGLMLMFAAIAVATLIARSPERGGVFLGLLSGFALVSVAAFAFVPEAVTSAMRLQSIMMGEGRIINLPDILFTVRQYWPWGAGFGTFVPIFMANENLDLLTGPYLNRAHNDLLELLIEAGLPGAVLLGIVLVLISVRLARVVCMRTALVPALAGFGTLALMLVHSLVDYPLRTDAIAAVAAVAIALFVSPAQKADWGETGTRRRVKGFGGSRSQSATAGISERRTR